MYMYIYIYIFVCVCVCLSVCLCECMRVKYQIKLGSLAFVGRPVLEKEKVNLKQRFYSMDSGNFVSGV